MSNIIEVKNLYKEYDNGLISALKDINLTLQEGKIYALIGASGCGKSTLLNLIGGLDSPTKGSVLYYGKALDEVGNLDLFRRDFIGYVFQFHHLIPVLTLSENVQSALLSDKSISNIQRKERASSLLKEMGLEFRLDSFASEVSGGERQRGAIARALVNNPKVILADEPTGNVDSKTAQLILAKLQKYLKQSAKCILIATHDMNVSAIADTIIEMKDAKIVSVTENLSKF